jgi:D,D-heptose 1,7-bisphosphate phosphatase
MAERAVFLDRDNTIIENDGYLGTPSLVKLLTGAATALSAIRALGYRLIVVSNQSGVARGMFTENDVEAVNQEMCRQLRDQAAAHIDASYYCPYHPESVIPEYKIDHDWRKPKPGMLYQAAADFNLDLSQCWMIGDQPRDIAAGTAVGCRTILLRDPDHPAGDADASGGAGLQVSPNFVVKTLADAARIIAREGKNPPPAAPAPTSTTPGAAPAPVKETPEQRLVRQTAQATPTAPNPAAAPAMSPKIERSLEELITLLRHQQRKSEAPADFSKLQAGAMLVQIFAVLALIVGIYRMAKAGASFSTWDQTYLVVTNLEHAGVYVLIAIVLQLMTIALLMFARSNER